MWPERGSHGPGSFRMARPSCPRRPPGPQRWAPEGRARSRSTPRGGCSVDDGRQRSLEPRSGRRPCGDVRSRPPLSRGRGRPVRGRPRRARRGLPQRARARRTRRSRARGQTRGHARTRRSRRARPPAGPTDIAMRSSPRIWTARPIDGRVDGEPLREWRSSSTEARSWGRGWDNDPIAARRRVRARIDELLQRARDGVRARGLAKRTTPRARSPRHTMSSSPATKIPTPIA